MLSTQPSIFFIKFLALPVLLHCMFVNQTICVENICKTTTRWKRKTIEPSRCTKSWSSPSVDQDATCEVWRPPVSPTRSIGGCLERICGACTSEGHSGGAGESFHQNIFINQIRNLITWGTRGHLSHWPFLTLKISKLKCSKFWFYLNETSK